jgi:hypothetical protein
MENQVVANHLDSNGNVVNLFDVVFKTTAGKTKFWVVGGINVVKDVDGVDAAFLKLYNSNGGKTSKLAKFVTVTPLKDDFKNYQDVVELITLTNKFKSGLGDLFGKELAVGDKVVASKSTTNRKLAYGIIERLCSKKAVVNIGGRRSQLFFSDVIKVN